MRVQLAADERVFIAGQTGSGKTYMARILCEPIGRLVVIDPKGVDPRNSLDPAEWRLEEWSPQNRRKLEKGQPARLHFVPDPEDEDWDALYRYLFQIGALTIYIDELHMALPDRWRSTYTGLHLVYQQGRGAYVRAIGVTQYPAYMPLITYDQAQWFYCFRILNREHRRKMADIMGDEVDEGRPAQIWPDHHGFWAYHVGWKRPAYYPGVEAEKPREKAAQAGELAPAKD